jgi:hypothetical protein
VLKVYKFQICLFTPPLGYFHITIIYAILLHLMFVGLYYALKCWSCLEPYLHELRIPFEMDTSMLGRVAAC